MMISSSMPYSFMCCKPHPSLIRRGSSRLRIPVRLGVWNMRTSTRSEPNSATRGASRDAHDGSGDSLVPRNASVRKETLRSGLFCSVVRIVEILMDQSHAHETEAFGGYSTSSCSVLPIYRVERYILLLAFVILVYENTNQSMII